MKKINIRSIIAFAAVLCFSTALLVGCSKQKTCRCSVLSETRGSTVRIIGTDGIDCDDITEMAEERHVTDPSTGEHTLERVEVHKVSCRSYGH